MGNINAVHCDFYPYNSLILQSYSSVYFHFETFYWLIQNIFSSFTEISFKSMILNLYTYGFWISPWVNVKRRDSQYNFKLI
jgi:hypothetical protein